MHPEEKKLAEEIGLIDKPSYLNPNQTGNLITKLKSYIEASNYHPKLHDMAYHIGVILPELSQMIVDHLYYEVGQEGLDALFYILMDSVTQPDPDDRCSGPGWEYKWEK